MFRRRKNVIIHNENKLMEPNNSEVHKEHRQMISYINEHFLFNTLNSILSLCRQNSEEARKVVLELTSYLRFNFNVTDEIIFLHDEIEYIKSYLYIQNVRFSGRVNVIYHIQEDVNFMIPKNSLYNLVDNAINHGILKKSSGGTITLTVERGHENILIKIEDDGVGMDEKQKISILKDENYGSVLSSKSKYEDLYNAKLEVVSKLNTGTIITLHIPVEYIKYEI
jgi:sensor histidine kinase YesM